MNRDRDLDLEKEKVESPYVTQEMAEDKEMDEKIRQDLLHAADQAEKEFREEEALGASRMKPEEKQQLFYDIVDELKKKGIWEESPEDQLSAEDREALRLGSRRRHIHLLFADLVGILLLPTLVLRRPELGGGEAPFLAVSHAEIFLLSFVLPLALLVQRTHRQQNVG